MSIRHSDVITGLLPAISYIACDMVWKLFSFKRSQTVPHDLYGSVVAQSRLPVFYEQLQIADTVPGRYDMLSLHLFLLSNVLSKVEDARAKPLNQEIFDAFTDNVDDALRQLGIGDTSVPKRKKRLVAQFYGHIESLSPTLENEEIETLSREVNKRFYDDANETCAAKLAQYLIEARNTLSATPFDKILRGNLSWPEPLNVFKAKQIAN